MLAPPQTLPGLEFQAGQILPLSSRHSLRKLFIEVCDLYKGSFGYRFNARSAEAQGGCSQQFFRL